jgi:hypothetical protein
VPCRRVLRRVRAATVSGEPTTTDEETLMPFAFVLSLVLAVMTEPLDQRMAPRAIALEIARVSRTPLEAAVMVEMAWEESRLIDRDGDSGRAHCQFQLWGRPPTDLRDCVERAHQKLAESFAACPDSPLSLYASGSCALARRLSSRRMSAAARLLAAVE